MYVLIRGVIDKFIVLLEVKVKRVEFFGFFFVFSLIK